MTLTPSQQEKLTIAIQGTLSVLIIGMSAINTVRTQTAHLKKIQRAKAKRKKTPRIPFRK